MKSKFFLNIIDPQMKRDYLLKRNTEVIKLSILLLASRLILVLSAVITQATNQHKFGNAVWGASVANNSFHILLLILTYKFPLIFSEVHSPLLTIGYFLSLISLSETKLNQVGLVNNV